MAGTGAARNTSTEMPEAGSVDMKLEVVTLPVSDVDRAKSFYQSLGWRLDADIAVGDAFRVIQFTPPHSPCSIAFGKGVTTGEPGSVQRLILAVDDIDAAREDLVRRGIEVSGLFHLAGGRFLAPTRRAAPTRRMPRSAIQMATGGCSRRSRRGFGAGSGTTDPGVPRRTPHPAPRICSRRMSAWPQCWANSRRACRYTQRRGSGPR